MVQRVLLLTAALTLVACGGLVVFDPDEQGDGGAGGTSSPSPGPGPGPGQTSNSSSGSSSSGMSPLAAYCTALDASEAEHLDCTDGLDLEECLAAEQCATSMLRPDAAPLLLDCLAKEGCYGVPNECLTELLGLPLTAAGQAFYDACTLDGDCPYESYCLMPYWLTDDALASPAGCIDGFECGLDSYGCFEDSTLWQCNGWLRKVNAWYL